MKSPLILFIAGSVAAHAAVFLTGPFAPAPSPGTSEHLQVSLAPRAIAPAPTAPAAPAAAPPASRPAPAARALPAAAPEPQPARKLAKPRRPRVAAAKPDTPDKRATSPGRSTKPAARSAQRTAPANSHITSNAALTAGSEQTSSPPGQTAGDGSRKRVRLELHRALASHFSYPALARRRGWQGEVRVALRIEPDGRLSEIRVVNTSGYGVLDRDAVRCLERVAEIPEAVPALGGSSLDLVLPVAYRLTDG